LPRGKWIAVATRIVFFGGAARLGLPLSGG
jgi:hypothetical protein